MSPKNLGGASLHVFAPIGRDVGAQLLSISWNGGNSSGPVSQVRFRCDVRGEMGAIAPISGFPSVGGRLRRYGVLPSLSPVFVLGNGFPRGLRLGLRCRAQSAPCRLPWPRACGVVDACRSGLRNTLCPRRCPWSPGCEAAPGGAQPVVPSARSVAYFREPVVGSCGRIGGFWACTVPKGRSQGFNYMGAIAPIFQFYEGFPS